jgi:hypothetical protein
LNTIGRAAFLQHVAALQEIVAKSGASVVDANNAGTD